MESVREESVREERGGEGRGGEQHEGREIKVKRGKDILELKLDEVGWKWKRWEEGITGQDSTIQCGTF